MKKYGELEATEDKWDLYKPLTLSIYHKYTPYPITNIIMTGRVVKASENFIE